MFYALIYVPENRAVYIGKTNNTQRRFNEHSRCRSACRLVCDFIQEKGKEHFRIDPILCCNDTDIDCNESFYILQMNTIYPNGLNLRHGSKAGITQNNTQLMSPPSNIGFPNISEELKAISNAWIDISEMYSYLICLDQQKEELQQDIKTKINTFLKEVHPDKNSSKAFTSNEVSEMLIALKQLI